jgi:hypothetical protein
VAPTSSPGLDGQVGLLRDTNVALMGCEGTYLRPRFGVVLACYLNERPPTVRGRQTVEARRSLGAIDVRAVRDRQAVCGRTIR